MAEKGSDDTPEKGDVVLPLHSPPVKPHLEG